LNSGGGDSGIAWSSTAPPAIRGGVPGPASSASARASATRWRSSRIRSATSVRQPPTAA
jgi:hypothetical protein